MTDNEPRDITKLLGDVERIESILRGAVREALQRHKLAGNPVAEWRDGRVVWIPPNAIESESGRT